MKKLIFFSLVIISAACKKDEPKIDPITTIIYRMELYDAINQKPAAVVASDAYVSVTYKSKDGSIKSITEYGNKCNHIALVEHFENAKGATVSMEIKSNLYNTGKLFQSKIIQIKNGVEKTLVGKSSNTGYTLTATIDQ